jgi:hypothetical protein
VSKGRIITDLQYELRETRHTLQRIEADLIEALRRAERAERSAQDAWSFAKVISHAPLRRT